MIDRLNLNDPVLVNERKKVIGEIENELGPLNGGSHRVGAIITTWHTPDSEGRLVGFAQAVYRYLEDEFEYERGC